MQKRYYDSFVFAAEFCRALFAVVVFAVTFIAAEVYVTNGHMLADYEIANGCAPCGASMLLAMPNINRAPN